MLAFYAVKDLYTRIFMKKYLKNGKNPHVQQKSINIIFLYNNNTLQLFKS